MQVGHRRCTTKVLVAKEFYVSHSRIVLICLTDSRDGFIRLVTQVHHHVVLLLLSLLLCRWWLADRRLCISAEFTGRLVRLRDPHHSAKE